jgi:hypothetical protein
MTTFAPHRETLVSFVPVNGILMVLIDTDGLIAEADIFYRTVPAGVALQRNLSEVTSMPPWELRTNEE